jgi:fatty-acid desaturase
LSEARIGHLIARLRRFAGAQQRIEVSEMVALLALVLILAIFGGLGFAAHVLWIVLIFAVLLWLIGFFVGGVAEAGGRRRWYGRW